MEFENLNNNNIQMKNNSDIFENNLRQQDTDCYSLRSVKLWCHNCRKEIKRLISSAPQEILCQSCNFALEIIENGQDHPSNFRAFEDNQRQQEQQRQQQQRQQEQQRQQQEQQRQQQEQQRQNPFFVFQQFFVPGNNEFFNLFTNPQQQQQNGSMNFFNDLLFGMMNGQQSSTHNPASEEKINKLNQVIVQCDDKDNSCPICYDHYKKGEVMNQLPCSHNFHQGCVKEWLNKNNSCPMCRKSI